MYTVSRVDVNDVVGLETLLNALQEDDRVIDFVFTALASIIVISH